MYLSEMLVYGAALSETQLAAAESGLARKWGITLAPQVSNADAQDWVNRVYANGGTVSAATANAVNDFANAIDAAGIRDRFYRLNLFCGTGLNACLVPLYQNRQRTAGRNLITKNEEYRNPSVYTDSRLTASAGTASPTGAPSLKFTETADSGVHLWRTNYSIPITVNQVYTWSVYVKDVTNGLVILRDNANRTCLFNLNSNTVTEGSGVTGVITDAGDGWYRLSITFVSTQSPGEFLVSLAPDGHSTAVLPAYAGDTGHSLVLSSPQLELGSLTEYDPTPFGNATDTNNGPFVSDDYVETGASGGLDGDGIGKYLNTGFNVSSLPAASDCHLSTYIRGTQSISAATGLIGAIFNGVTDRYRIAFNTATAGNYSTLCELGKATQVVVTRANESDGLVLLSRTSTTSLTLYGDDASIGTNVTSTAETIGNFPFYVFCRNSTSNAPVEFYNGVMAGYSIGGGMDSSDVSAYYTALQAFQTALGRNV